MEELKNNETSEKKETIEPLEVITLEDDENQVAEEKMDSPVIRRGDIYSFEDQEWRVFDVRDKNVNLINLKNNKLRLKNTTDLITAIENRECVKIKEKTESSFSIPPEEMETINHRAEVMEAILRKEYPLTTRLRMNHDSEAIILGVTRRYLSMLFYTYLRSGRNKFSLVDQRKNNSRPKNSHSKDYENPKNDVDENLK